VSFQSDRKKSDCCPGADHDGRFHVLRSGGPGRLRGMLQSTRELHTGLHLVVQGMRQYDVLLLRDHPREQSNANEGAMSNGGSGPTSQQRRQDRRRLGTERVHRDRK